MSVSVAGRCRAVVLLAATFASAYLDARVAAAELPVIPLPDLSQADPHVRQQLGDQREHLDAMLASEPSPRVAADALALMGELYLAYDFLLPAEACLEAVLERREEDFRGHYLLGYLAERTGELDRAIELLEGAIELEPANAPALLRLGKTLLARGQDDHPEALFERAFAADPSCAAALYGLGEVARQAGDHETAAVHYSRAVEIAPDVGQMRYALGQSLRQLGRVEEAQQQLAKVDFRRVSLQGDSWEGCADPLLAEIGALTTGAWAHLMRGAQAYFTGSVEIEVSEYRKAIELTPDDHVAQKSLASALERAGEPDEAALHYRRAIELAPNNPSYRHQLAGIVRERGSTEEATELYRSALELEPGFRGSRFALGEIAEEAGRLEEAIEHYAELGRRNPQDFQARARLGAALMKVGRQQEALGELGRLLDDNPPEDPENHLQMASMLLVLGDEERALRHLRDLADGAGSAEVRARAHSRIGASLLVAGDVAGGVSHLERALEIDPGLEEAQQSLEGARQLEAQP